MPGAWRGRITSFSDVISINRDEEEAERLMVSYKGFMQSQEFSVKLDIDELAKQVMEIALNFVSHSEAGDAAVFFCQHYPNLKSLSLAFGDAGQGIKTSLSASADYSFLKDQEDYQAIETAIGGATSRASGGGYGFPQLLDYIRVNSATLCLTSGKGYYSYKPKLPEALERIGSLPYELTGVQIGITIPLK